MKLAPSLLFLFVLCLQRCDHIGIRERCGVAQRASLSDVAEEARMILPLRVLGSSASLLASSPPCIWTFLNSLHCRVFNTLLGGSESLR